MPDHLVHKASDLAGDERLMIERWLGGTLSNDETIGISAYRPHIPPDAENEKFCARASWPKPAESARAPGKSPRAKSKRSSVKRLMMSVLAGGEVHSAFEHLVRAVMTPLGPALRVLDVVLAAHTLVLSRFIFDEVERVLPYPRIQFPISNHR